MLNNRSIENMNTKDTKEIILQKTFHLLLIKGYDAVSISDIQHATGMARGLLYHYFGGKKQLFIEATKLYVNKLLGMNDERIKDYGLPELIDYMIEKYTEVCTNNWASFPIEEEISFANYDFLLYRMIRESEEIAEIYNYLRGKELAAWQRAASVSLQKKEITSDIPPDKLAELFDCLTDGVWTGNALTTNGTSFVDNLRDKLERFYLILQERGPS